MKTQIVVPLVAVVLLGGGVVWYEQDASQGSVKSESETSEQALQEASPITTTSPAEASSVAAKHYDDDDEYEDENEHEYEDGDEDDDEHEGGVSSGVASESTSSETQSTTSGASSTSGTYTLADVKLHSDASSCWTAINGGVDDVTSWIDQHPGSNPFALRCRRLCGV